MKLVFEKIKSILIFSGILIFIESILFTGNLKHIKINANNIYTSIAAK
jgi:uncharacterized membrane protein YgdD (TMEM256/DUF423 family)